MNNMSNAKIKAVIEALSERAFAGARKRGFYPELDKGRDYHSPQQAKTCVNPLPPLMQLYQEVGELAQAARKPVLAQSKQCPEFYEFEVELADILTTVLSLAEATKARLGEALLAKMEFNKTRPDDREDKRF